MSEENKPAFDLDKVLKSASQAPAGMELREYNPLESFPTLAVGDEITPGTTINGYFEGTERIASHKFKNSTEKDANGKPVQLLHKMRLVDGQVIGIWTTGELRMVFEKIQVGEFLSLTYKGKGTNANNQAQHFFEYKRGVTAN